MTAILLSVILLLGCATSREKIVEKPMEGVNVSQQSEGYALLYDLVSREKHIGLLLLVKKESPPLEAVIKKIADASSAATSELENLAKSHPPLDLKTTHLPSLELRTRELIDSETGKELLKSRGVQFEFKLLQTQVQGMSYGAYLAKTLAATETNATRRAFLQKTSQRFFALHDEVYQMILNRYAR